MKSRDKNYPTVDEIKLAVAEYVAKQCNGVWPEDEWFTIGEKWCVNLYGDPYAEPGERCVAVHYESIDDEGFRESDTDCGIVIPMEPVPVPEGKPAVKAKAKANI